MGPGFFPLMNTYTIKHTRFFHSEKKRDYPSAQLHGGKDNTATNGVQTKSSFFFFHADIFCLSWFEGKKNVTLDTINANETKWVLKTFHSM